MIDETQRQLDAAVGLLEEIYPEMHAHTLRLRTLAACRDISVEIAASATTTAAYYDRLCERCEEVFLAYSADIK